MAYDLGQFVPLTIVTTDASGQPADAGTVVLTITKPDLTTEPVTPDHPDVGRYEVDYLPADPGLYRYRWVATGVNTSAYSGVFYVNDATPEYIVSLDDVKAHLNIDLSSTRFDAELRGFLAAATPVIEDVVDDVVVKERSEVAECEWSDVIVLAHRPAVELLAIETLRTVEPIYSYDISLIDLDKPTGILRSMSAMPRFFGPLRITYMAGRPTIPANITHGGKELIRHMWDTQRGHAASRPGLGDDEIVTTSSGYTMPRRVYELLVQRKGPTIA